MDDRVFCSQQNPAEPLAGTADPVGAWLMIEYRPVWKARVREDNSLAPATQAWIERTLADLAAAGIRARPQFVRQPEIDSDQVRVMLAMPGQLRVFAGTGYDFLESLDLAAVASGRLDFGRRETEPQYFVCTNGQRDLCCARFGLPTYAALREQVGARAWQVTHLGGHRFAPNVLVLPAGALYGRVVAASVPEFVATVEAGSLAFAHLRGRTYQPRHVQAAEAFIGRSDLRLLHVDGDEARARIRFATPDGSAEIAVRRAARGLPVIGSCGDSAAEPVFPFERD